MIFHTEKHFRGSCRWCIPEISSKSFPHETGYRVLNKIINFRKVFTLPFQKSWLLRKVFLLALGEAPHQRHPQNSFLRVGGTDEGRPHVEEKRFSQQPILVEKPNQRIGETKIPQRIHNALFYVKSFSTRSWGYVGDRPYTKKRLVS